MALLKLFLGGEIGKIDVLLSCVISSATSVPLHAFKPLSHIRFSVWMCQGKKKLYIFHVCFGIRTFHVTTMAFPVLPLRMHLVLRMNEDDYWSLNTMSSLYNFQWGLGPKLQSVIKDLNLVCSCSGNDTQITQK